MERIIGDKSKGTEQERLDNTPCGVFATEIKKVFLSVFPKSRCYSRFERGLGHHITISISMANDKTECSHGYFDNDLLGRTMFMIQGLPDDGSLPESMTIKTLTGLGFSVHDETAGYTKSRRIKAGFRKTTGSSERILKALDRNFNKLRDLLIENKDIVKGYNTELFDLADKLGIRG